MTAPFFYSPEAVGASMLSCGSGHEVSREAAQMTGRLVYATWGCPFCAWPDSGVRQGILGAYHQGVRDGRRGSQA